MQTQCMVTVLWTCYFSGPALNNHQNNTDTAIVYRWTGSPSMLTLPKICHLPPRVLTPYCPCLVQTISMINMYGCITQSLLGKSGSPMSGYVTQSLLGKSGSPMSGYITQSLLGKSGSPMSGYITQSLLGKSGSPMSGYITQSLLGKSGSPMSGYITQSLLGKSGSPMSGFQLSTCHMVNPYYWMVCKCLPSDVIIKSTTCDQQVSIPICKVSSQYWPFINNAINLWLVPFVPFHHEEWNICQLSWLLCHLFQSILTNPI